jgi:hypothetical protein
MSTCNQHNRKIRWTVVLLLIVVVMVSCSGIQPYEPRNHREEGPEKGLFTGSEGEWVIYRKADEKATDSENQKGLDQNKDNENEDDGQSQSSE